MQLKEATTIVEEQIVYLPFPILGCAFVAMDTCKHSQSTMGIIQK